MSALVLMPGHVGQVTLFHFEDQLRDNAATVVEVLKERCDLRVLMLTGDNASTAKRVAKSVGIDEFHAGLKPEDKLNQIHRLSQEKSIALNPTCEFLKICLFVSRSFQTYKPYQRFEPS